MRFRNFLATSLVITIGLGATSAWGSWVFKEVSSAPDEPEVFLWSDANNWLDNDFEPAGSLPRVNQRNEGTNDRAYIGHNADQSPVLSPVRATVRTAGLTCAEIRVGYNRSAPGGSSLTIESGSLTTSPNLGIRVGYYQSGSFAMKGGTFNVSTDFDIGAKGVAGIGTATMSGGLIKVGGGLYVGHSGEAMTRGSSFAMTGGKIVVMGDAQVGSTDARRPGVLKIGGDARLSAGGKTEICENGVLEVVGGDARISVQDLNVRAGATVKLSGDGVGAITAAAVTIAPGAVLDVSKLAEKRVAYKLIAADSITGAFTFAEGTDTDPSGGGWSVGVVGDGKVLQLAYSEGGAVPAAAPPAAPEPAAAPPAPEPEEEPRGEPEAQAEQAPETAPADVYAPEKAPAITLGYWELILILIGVASIAVLVGVVVAARRKGKDQSAS